MGVLFDVQGIQSLAHGDRGIARYLIELATALERWHPGRVEKYLLNRQLAVPASSEPLTHSGRMVFADRLESTSASVYHVGSPIELAVPLDRLWPTFARRRGMRLVVTVYDLIPVLHPEIYLGDTYVRQKYRTRIELVRRADCILAISEATARDVVQHLSVSPDRVRVAGAGVSDRFRPPKSRAAAFKTLRSRLDWLDSGYILYTGGIEPRKNIDRLLEAYASLPKTLRDRHQLVVVCRVLPAERGELDRHLDSLGVTGRVVFPGFVPENQLILLYQAAHLFVFPSLYEGFGFPVAEAMACGTPVIASSTSSIAELVHDEEAQFNPRDVQSIAAALRRTLMDAELLDRLRELRLDAKYTWRHVAEQTVAAYDDLLTLPTRRRRRRPRIAFVSPLPPQQSGVADETARLLAALHSHADIDAFVDGDATEIHAPSGIAARPLRHFATSEQASGGYDRVFFCLGNSEFHAGAIALMRERRGIAIAHDVRLTGLYIWMAKMHPEVVPGGVQEAIRSMYGDRVPHSVGAIDHVDFWDAARYGVFMAREAIALSERFLVHSRHAAQLARLDCAPGDEAKIETLPYGVISPTEIVGDEERDLVGTFGIVSPTKQPDRLLESWPAVLAELPDAKLAVVGTDGGTGEIERLRRLASDLGVERGVQFTGRVSEARFRRWVARTAVAVQLRAVSNGETSAVVARCLAGGVATIVSSVGSAAELPDDAVVKVTVDVTPDALATEIVALLRDRDRRASLRAGALRYAEEHSFERVAQELADRFL